MKGAKMNLSKKTIISGTIILILLIAGIRLTLYLKSVSDYKQAVKSITLGKTDITEIPDGTYTGECNVDFIYAKVKVVIHNGEIKNITILEHKNERGKAAEAVIDNIVNEQKIDVDAVSGATNSSTVLKKAVENALTQ